MSNPHLPPQEELDPDHPDYVDPDEVEESHGAMPFLQHLDDLRKALWKSSLAVAVGMFGGWVLAPRILEDLIARTVKTAVVLSPFEGFNERFKLSFILGIGFALPVVFWQIWGFIVPGLLKRERTWVPYLAIGSMVLFALGAWAAYGYVVPLVIHVLEQFLVKGVLTQIRLSSLLEFVYNMALACGILMQLPLVTMLLTGIGLVKPMFLLQQWRVALIVIFVLTALITPGDVISAQVVMGLPMVALYFLSVGLSFFVAKKQSAAEKLAEAEWASDSDADDEDKK
ncbi:MAG: twin-arginine translocase subunit TatC [Candidatus Eisenbacteria bacterium]|nr:twin-arginine translocase subunit TatC [Candidatus Eisenbacteria bacterium]